LYSIIVSFLVHSILTFYIKSVLKFIFPNLPPKC
jgi:hypothetical protein